MSLPQTFPLFQNTLRVMIALNTVIQSLELRVGHNMKLIVNLGKEQANYFFVCVCFWFCEFLLAVRICILEIVSELHLTNLGDKTPYLCTLSYFKRHLWELLVFSFFNIAHK